MNTALTLMLLLAQNQISLEGFVVKLGTGDAVPNARVILSKVDGGLGQGYAITATGGGKFVFPNVPPGRYRLFATKNGYIRAEYGQRSPKKRGVEIAVASGVRRTDLGIQMMPTGAIAGRVFDLNGEPVPDVSVEALKYTYGDGERTFTRIQQTHTNDFGEYRLFYLEPGQYYVSAIAMDQPRLEGNMLVTASNPAMGANERGLPTGTTIQTTATPENTAGIIDPAAVDESYLPVYFPGTYDSQTAAPIDLRPGANYTGVDFTVAPSRTFRVRGQAINGMTGQPARGADIRLVPRQSGFASAVRPRGAGGIDQQGSFEIKGVAPGAYYLTATLRTAGYMLPSLSASIPVDVNGDVDNIGIVLNTVFLIPVRFSFEGPPNPETTGMSIRLTPDFDMSIGSVGNSKQMSLRVIPGDYRITVTGLPRNSYIKAAHLGSSDVLNELLHIDGQPKSPLEVVIGTNTGHLGGTVLDGRQQPVVGSTIVLVPDAVHRKRFDLYKSVSSDTSGRFGIEGIAPGDYKIFAWDDVEAGAWQDPNFIRLFEDRGRPVRIDEGGQVNVELRVIPSDI